LLNSDQEFHDVVATISGNAVLRQIIREVHVHSAMAWDNLEMDKDEHVRIAARHMAVAVAISEGNVEATRLAVADHMESVREEQTTKGSDAGSSSPD
jgi:DNA-binding FadR family transcriptional regulator